jgi:mannose-6-phosphate isomerase
MNIPLCQPVRFRPLSRSFVWGGRRLTTLLGKQHLAEQTIAESWEIVDHGDSQSRVIGGPMEGMTLHELVTLHGQSLLGIDFPQATFPLLFKYLDCQQNLSVQVHPDDQQAARLDPPCRGKTEAWVVLEAEPESRVYAGLKQGVRRDELQTALQQGNMESILHWFEPNVGDCILIPAGTVHAIGAGLLIAEIQQTSDITYRLFDWDRMGDDGRPRELHLEAGLEVVDFQAEPCQPQTPIPGASPQEETLVHCPGFVLDRITLESPTVIGGDDHCRILSVLAGEVTVGKEVMTLTRGETCLLPAAAGEQPLVPVGKSIVLSARQP